MTERHGEQRGKDRDRDNQREGEGERESEKSERKAAKTRTGTQSPNKAKRRDARFDVLRLKPIIQAQSQLSRWSFEKMVTQNCQNLGVRPP